MTEMIQERAVRATPKPTVLDLFSGIGGMSLGLERAGFETAAFCEIEPFPRGVLAKHWPWVPCYDDVRLLSAALLARDGIGRIDAICGGFPCQDASIANTSGTGRDGINGSRTGLWSEIARLADALRPSVIVLENVPGLLSSGFGRVLGDLAEIRYDAEWRVIPAFSAGLPHRRERLWVVAYPCGSRLSRPLGGESILESAEKTLPQLGYDAAGSWRSLDARIGSLRGRDGVRVGMDRPRLKACGNAVVPVIAEAIGRAIMNRQMMEAAE